MPYAPVVTRKEPFVAGLLSFFIPGAGQMYAGKVGAGIGWLIFTFIGYAIFVVPGLILHVICIAGAATAAREANEQTGQQAPAPPVYAAAPTVYAPAPAPVRSAPPLPTGPKALGPAEFVERLGKMHRLLTTGLLEPGEFQSRKSALITELAERPVTASTDDFLSALIDLKAHDAINHTDVVRIKALLGRAADGFTDPSNPYA